MGGWSRHVGVAVALPLANIDTDQLVPARFMPTPRSEGYGAHLLYDLRRDEAGVLRPGFPLNAHDGVSILVAGRNFGTGSSREAAVYALVDAGIRAVIAPGFGDIFASNAVSNGLLPARIGDADSARLLTSLGACAEQAEIDVATGRIVIAGMTLTFEIEESWRLKLLNGWDDIDLTQQHADEIRQFRNARRQAVPWAWPVAGA